MTGHRTATCRAHCRGCDTCFSSDIAFDYHRKGDFGFPNESPAGRHCEVPFEELIHTDGVNEGKPVYEFVIGECRDAHFPKVIKDVKIWTFYGRREAGQKLREMSNDPF